MYLLSMIAFSVQRSSVGKLCDCHCRRLSGSERNSVRANSARYEMLAISSWCFHAVNRFCLKKAIYFNYEIKLNKSDKTRKQQVFVLVLLVILKVCNMLMSSGIY